MPLKSINIIFTEWLQENLHRFDHHPYLIEDKDHCLIFRFTDIDRRVELIVGKNGNFEISVHYRNRFWDFVCDFDVAPGLTKGGKHYCKLCLSPGRKYYPSLADLVRRHALEPLLLWANETFQKNKFLALFQVRGCTWVEIVEAGSIPNVQKRKEMVFAFPLVRPNNPAIKERR